MNLHDLNIKSFYIAVNILLPLCTYAQFISYSFDREDLETEIIQTCLERNSCSEIANSTLEGIRCHCDSKCAVFGDCCIDAIRMSSKRTLSQICMDFGNDTNQGVYVVNRCPPNYAGPEEIRQLCLNDDFSDIAKSAPVTDYFNRQIYLNRYCATCNEVPFIFIKAWSISACRVENPTLTNFSLSDMIYNATEKKWGYQLKGLFHNCKLVFEKPPPAAAIGRTCRLDYISSCPITWNETDYLKACESYTAVVMDSNDILYKNPHCAICNGVNLSDIACQSNFFPMSITGRMDINRAFGAYRTYHPIFNPPPRLCPEGQRYDRYFGKCRPIECAFPGYYIRNGRCVEGGDMLWY